MNMRPPNAVDTLVPFLKWAGGKRWFVDKYSHLIPREFDCYYEPFLGAGAMFFALKPRKAIISDLNSDLINLYLSIRNDPKQIAAALREYQKKHSKDFYYQEREKRYGSDLRRAAQMLYLNRTCFNGLYRVNLKGKFNVPIGTKNAVVLDTDDFEWTSEILNKNVEIACADFETIIERASKGDFLFVDPPYTVAHNHNNFVKYNDKIFSWNDQIRLADTLQRAADRGVKILALNANHEAINRLYYNIGELHTVKRSSVISGSANFRGVYEELAILIGFTPGRR